MNFHKLTELQPDMQRVTVFINLDLVVKAKPWVFLGDNTRIVTLTIAGDNRTVDVLADEFEAAIAQNGGKDLFHPFERAVRDFCAAVNRMPTSLRVHY